MLTASVLAVAGTLMLLEPAQQAQDTYKVIVNLANPTSSLSLPQLSTLFFEAATWDDGQTVLPVDQAVSAPVRELFSKDVHGMSTGSVVERWKRVSAAGGKTPLAVATDEDVIQYVRLKLGAIGYVSAAADVSAVRVVSIQRTAAGVRPAVARDSLIRNVLSAYVSALEGRDLDALKRIWPGVSPAQERAIRAEFDHSRTLQVELLDPRIDVQDTHAVVVARRRYALTTTEGTRLPSETVTTLTLRQAAGGWLIEGIRYRSEP